MLVSVVSVVSVVSSVSVVSAKIITSQSTLCHNVGSSSSSRIRTNSNN